MAWRSGLGTGNSSRGNRKTPGLGASKSCQEPPNPGQRTLGSNLHSHCAFALLDPHWKHLPVFSAYVAHFRPFFRTQVQYPLLREPPPLPGSVRPCLLLAWPCPLPGVYQGDTGLTRTIPQRAAQNRKGTWCRLKVNLALP